MLGLLTVSHFFPTGAKWPPSSGWGAPLSGFPCPFSPLLLFLLAPPSSAHLHIHSLYQGLVRRLSQQPTCSPDCEGRTLPSAPAVGTTCPGCEQHVSLAHEAGPLVPVLCSQLLSASHGDIAGANSSSPPRIPGKPPGRWRSTPALSGPPKCKSYFLGGGQRVLTPFLIHILQLHIYFTVYEDPKGWPTELPHCTQMAFSAHSVSICASGVWFSTADPKGTETGCSSLSSEVPVSPDK